MVIVDSFVFAITRMISMEAVAPAADMSMHSIPSGGASQPPPNSIGGWRTIAAPARLATTPAACSSAMRSPSSRYAATHTAVEKHGGVS